MANSGHIIVHERDSMDRALRNATAAVVEHDREAMRPLAMPKFNRGEGLYEIEEKKTPKKLSYYDIRALAEAFANHHNLRAVIAIDDKQAAIELRRRFDKTKKGRCAFSAQFPPTEKQVRDTLNHCAGNLPY